MRPGGSDLKIIKPRTSENPSCGPRSSPAGHCSCCRTVLKSPQLGVESCEGRDALRASALRTREALTPDRDKALFERGDHDFGAGPTVNPR
jgi:hypothetical protein